MATTMLEPTVHVLTKSEIVASLEEIEEQFGVFEELLHKAEIESLSPSERAALRRMKRLKFLLG